MDINQKLRQRRLKIELEKKHTKDKLMKNLRREKLNAESSNTGSISFDNVLEKFSKSENNKNELDKIIKNTDQSSNLVKQTSNSRVKKENNTKDSIKKDVKQASFNNNNNYNTGKGEKVTGEKLDKFAKLKQYKKLTMKNSRGQPILKNKIEFLYKKLLNSRK